MTEAQPAVASLDFRERRRQLIPNIDEAERQGLIPFPYVMLLPQPGYTSASANADENGFRISIRGGRRVILDRLRATEESTGAVKKGAFLGNGVAWGTGTTGDDKVVHNVLNATRPMDVWYSVALRATSMTQERISAELFAPLDTAYTVWLSGVRMLDLSLYKVPHDAVMPFPGEDLFLDSMSMPARPLVEFTMEQRWAEVLALFEREIALYSRAFGAPPSRAIFALQAGLAWCDKPRSPEEREMAAFGVAGPNASGVDPDAFRSYLEIFAVAAQKICARYGVTFIDVAKQPEFLVPDWLFADGGHLTDAGHAALARVISRHLP